MNLFGTKSTQNSYEVPVIEGYTVENGGDLLALEESARDYHNIIKSMHSMEMTRLQESAYGEDLEAVTESAVKNTLEKIKKFFKDLAGKIKAFLGSLVMAFDALTKNGNDFAKKYENALKKRDLKGMEVKIHAYTNLDFKLIDKSDGKVSDEVADALDYALRVASSANSEEDVEKAKEALADTDKEEYLDTFRGGLVGRGRLTADEFPEALYSYFRKNVDSKHDIPEGEVKIAEILANLRDTKPAKDVKGMAAAYTKRMDSVVAQINRVADAIQKALDKTEKDKNVDFKHKDAAHSVSQHAANVAIAHLRQSASLTQSTKGIGLAAIRALKTAIAERTRVSKAICLRAATYKPEKKN